MNLHRFFFTRKYRCPVCGEHYFEEIGAYECLGFDTFGPFRLIGGIAKGHPDAGEIAGAVKFYRELK